MTDPYGKEIAANPEDEFDKYMLEGGFPYSVRLDSFAAKRLYTKSVIDEIYKKDICKNKRIKKQTFVLDDPNIHYQQFWRNDVNKEPM